MRGLQYLTIKIHEQISQIILKCIKFKAYFCLFIHTIKKSLKRYIETPLNFEKNAKSEKKSLKIYITCTFISIFEVIETAVILTGLQHSKMQLRLWYE